MSTSMLVGPNGTTLGREPLALAKIGFGTGRTVVGVAARVVGLTTVTTGTDWGGWVSATVVGATVGAGTVVGAMVAGGAVVAGAVVAAAVVGGAVVGGAVVATTVAPTSV